MGLSIILFLYINMIIVLIYLETELCKMGKNKNIFLELICEILSCNGLEESYKENVQKILKCIADMPDDDFMACLLLINEYRSDDPEMPIYSH